jgi:hypothetical protein
LKDKLAQIQNKFQNYLLTVNNEIAQHISNPTRLAIYHEAYHARLLMALASNYPMLKIYLGEDLFTQIAEEYVRQYPSSHRSIRWFGDQLPLFLADSFLAELALVEWTMSLVYDAVEAPIFSLEAMVATSPDAWASMRFTPHPSAHSLLLNWNTIAIWQALMAQQPPPDPIPVTATTWIFWREHLTSRFCALPFDEAWALQALLMGLTFGEICQGLSQWSDEATAAFKAASLLKSWISAHLISNISYSNES